MATNVINPGGGIDTSDATATADKIFPGYTAYVNNEKITGTGTSDATATAAQILSGYSAYVNGSKINGSLIPSETATMLNGVMCSKNSGYSLYSCKVYDNGTISTLSYEQSTSTSYFNVSYSSGTVSVTPKVSGRFLRVNFSGTPSVFDSASISTSGSMYYTMSTGTGGSAIFYIGS